jgi:hypothetical protein
MSTLSDSPMDAELRAHVRQLLDAGALPLRSDNQKLYGGRGSKQLCDCCGEIISISDVLYEVESPEHSLLAMHRTCFEAWETESRGRVSNARKETPYGACSVF